MPNLVFSPSEAHSLLPILQNLSGLPPVLLALKNRLERELRVFNTNSALPTPSLSPSPASGAEDSGEGRFLNDLVQDANFLDDFGKGNARNSDLPITPSSPYGPDPFLEEEDLSGAEFSGLSTLPLSRTSPQYFGDKDEADQLILELLEESGLMNNFTQVSSFSVDWSFLERYRISFGVAFFSFLQ